MNQHDQMREALRLALAALKRVRHVDQQHAEAEQAVEQALATKPAPLVRLTESELLKAFTTAEKRKLVWQVDRERYLRHARIVMDAMEKLNGE